MPVLMSGDPRIWLNTPFHALLRLLHVEVPLTALSLGDGCQETHLLKAATEMSLCGRVFTCQATDDPACFACIIMAGWACAAWRYVQEPRKTRG